MEREYDYPVYATQRGGLVREIKTDKGYTYIFVEKPDCPPLDVGDTMPEQWGIHPANDRAMKSLNDEQFGSEEELRSEILLTLLRHSSEYRPLN